MLGLGPWELLVVLFVLLLIFGRRFPSVARSIGRSIKSFREGLREADIRNDIEDTVKQ